jgi:glutamyl-tRNA synthetase
MCNWLVRIGWSHGDQEIFTRDEIRALFDLAAVHRASGQADLGKLDWINQHWIKTLPGERMRHELQPFLEAAAGAPVAPSAGLAALLDLLRERSKTLVEMAERARFFAIPDEALVYDAKAVQKHWKPVVRPALEALCAALARVEPWEPGGIEGAFAAVRAPRDLALAPLAQAVRVAITGSAASPGIYETLAAVGRERSVARLERALAQLPG